MSTMTRDEMHRALVAKGVSEAHAAKLVDANLPAPREAMAPSVLADREARLESVEENEIVKVWRTLGGRVWRTSTVRAAKITPGFPDLLITHEPWGFAMWWEVKTAAAMRTKAGGRSPEQVDFAEHITAAQHRYGTGTFIDFLMVMSQHLDAPQRAEFTAAVDRAGLTPLEAR